MEIEISSGTGAGQTRTITAVADPVVHESGIATAYAAGPPAAVDRRHDRPGRATNTGLPNRGRNYQLRLTYSAGQIQMRRILYNSTNVLYFNAYNVGTYDPWYSAPLAVAATANSTLYQIESSIITVNTAWTVNPDSTSKFNIKGGGVWVASGSNATPWYTWQYYDIASDVWYNKGTQQNLIPATITGADIGMEVVTARTGALTANQGAISVGASPFDKRTLIDAGQNLPINQYANAMLHITGGAGSGQKRMIVAHNATTFFICATGTRFPTLLPRTKSAATSTRPT